MKDFFISYNQADRYWAEWVAWQLEAVGHITVVQAWDFRPGANFALEMHLATQEANRTIAILSPDFLDSPFTMAEWAAAFATDPSARKSSCTSRTVTTPEVGYGGWIERIDEWAYVHE